MIIPPPHCGGSFRGSNAIDMAAVLVTIAAVTETPTTLYPVFSAEIGKTTTMYRSWIQYKQYASRSITRTIGAVD